MLRTSSLVALLGALSAAPAASQDLRQAGPGPHLNFYGVPGLIDMPSGLPLPDAEIALTANYFQNVGRGAFTFQFAPRLSGTFRYAGVSDFIFGDDVYYDRSFDLRFTILNEGPRLPAVTVGLQDFVGTGIYSSEYLAATKTIGPLIATGGIGWGRFATEGEFDSPFGLDDRPDDFEPTGGTPNADRFFRGPAAFFGGVEWRPNDRLSLVAEYSSDAYLREEETGAVDVSSPFNFGVSYRPAPGVALGGYYLYGEEIAARLSFTVNARRPTPGSGAEGAPLPVRLSGPDLAATASWSEAATPGPAGLSALTAATAELFDEQGLVLEALRINGAVATVRLDNPTYGVDAQAIGRAARALTYTMPEGVRRFDIVLLSDGVPVSMIAIDRGALARQEFALDGPDTLLAVTDISDAARPGPLGQLAPDRYPRLSYSVGPFVSTFLFDVEDPLRLDTGVEVEASYNVAPGLSFDGAVRAKVAGNIEDADLPGEDAPLPRVRTDGVRFARASDVYLADLTGSYTFRPVKDVYSRFTAGYLESMFGGISTEVLWKPVASRLALGVELNYARQREFERLFGFQDYDVVTGHASAYYNFPNGYLGQVDAGRYLAGDYGATFTLAREMKNGWRVGAFATFTDVSFEDFGEGSFDKGITLAVPLGTISNRPARRDATVTLRPLTRDGGARLRVPDRLYDRVRDYHAPELTEEWDRVYR